MGPTECYKCSDARSFLLTIEQRDNERFSGAGTARLVLVRRNRSEPWRMRSWYDRSEF
ncbi:hypothetical protein GCM10023185_19570 [Hymenobacter saemangeumensis]|uniref:Uncharacterized protein n=1 Tax=Hymenobacter saemangeumensis TaxID=1084522 RepID=A0ABP8ICV4_9BACT